MPLGGACVPSYPCCEADEPCGSVSCQSHCVHTFPDLIDFSIAHCSRDATCHASLRPKIAFRKSPATAACVPTFFGQYLEERMRPFIKDWLDHQKKIGIEDLYLYSEADMPGWLPDLIDENKVTWIKMNFPLEGMWYHGQNWALNDCLKRALTEGFSRVLSVDLDEFLHFDTYDDTADTYFKSLSNRHDLEIITFGATESNKKTDHLRDCASNERRSCQATPPPLDDVVCFRGQPTDRDYEGDAPQDKCPKWHGHRKHIVSTPKVLIMDIHGPPWLYNGCLRKPHDDSPCNLRHESTNRAFLRHYRGGTPENTNLCPACVI